MSAQLVVFDIDGTLTNTKTVEDKCFISAFHKAFGLNITDTNWDDFPNVTDWAITETIIAREWSRMPTSEEYRHMIDIFEKELLNERKRDAQQFQEVPGASAFFHRLLADESFKVAIATGSWARSAKVKLASIGIDTTELPFAHSNHFKSRADIILEAIEQARLKYGEHFESVVYFGDGAWDYRTCRELDIPFIGIDAAKDQVLKNLGASQVFPNFIDTRAILYALESYQLE